MGGKTKNKVCISQVFDEGLFKQMESKWSAHTKHPRDSLQHIEGFSLMCPTRCAILKRMIDCDGELHYGFHLHSDLHSSWAQDFDEKRRLSEDGDAI